MINTALAWLLGSKTGRIIALCALAAALVYVALRVGFAKGERAERAEQALATLKTITEKVRSDETIRSLTPDERRERLRSWSRD